MKILIGILGIIFKIYIAIVFSITLLLFYLPILILKQKENTKKATFKVFILWSWAFRILTFIHVRKLKTALLPEGPYIVVSNHASYLDIFLMYSIIPKHAFLFLGKSEILSYPLMKTFFKNLNIPVFRDNRMKAARSFIESKKAIKNGWSLVVFPEGGIPDDNAPKMMKFKEGAFKLAKELNVPIIPITFLNNYKLFSDPGEVLGPGRPGISKLIIHEYLSVKEIQQMTVEELSGKVFEIIESAQTL
jgi:1-acyl-sn-glycerol-3-phosphate acyltransferase